MKTAELTGAALDWAVAKIEHPNLLWGSGIGIHHASHQIVIPHLPEPQCYWSPSTNWAQGGPIIELNAIQLTPDEYTGTWRAYTTNEGEPYEYKGQTPLIAAMRCFVASNLGDEVELPKELIE
jgi:hypothetical protein